MGRGGGKEPCARRKRMMRKGKGDGRDDFDRCFM